MAGSEQLKALARQERNKLTSENQHLQASGQRAVLMLEGSSCPAHTCHSQRMKRSSLPYKAQGVQGSCTWVRDQRRVFT